MIAVENFRPPPPPIGRSSSWHVVTQPTNGQPRILVVEDDPVIGKLLAGLLTDNGFDVCIVVDGREMDRVLAVKQVDLLVLDIMLPREDGFSICRRIRAASSIPIMMVTARGGEMDRVAGLEIGADDYLIKPFGAYELLARIRSLLRRAQSVGADARSRRAGTAKFAGWVLDLGTRRLHSPDGTRVPLTATEYKLLAVFCERANRTLSRDQLIDLTRERPGAGTDRSVDIQVSRLRRKIEADPRDPLLIQTVRSDGYIFAAEVQFA